MTERAGEGYPWQRVGSEEGPCAFQELTQVQWFLADFAAGCPGLRCPGLRCLGLRTSLIGYQPPKLQLPHLKTTDGNNSDVIRICKYLKY